MILGSSDERRSYDKDPDLMSKSQFMSLRKKCTMPYYYAHICGIRYENEAMNRGTEVHGVCEGALNNFKAKPIDINKDGVCLSEWLPDYSDRCIPYVNNFMRIYCMITHGNFDKFPEMQEIVVQADDGNEIGTLDQLWKFTCGKRGVIDVKTSKFKPRNLADIRLETAFYARMVPDAEYIGAMFLGKSESQPYGGFFFEKIKPALNKRLDAELKKTWEIRNNEAFERTPTPLCAWCDYKKECQEDCTKSEWNKVKRQIKFGNGLK